MDVRGRTARLVDELCRMARCHDVDPARLARISEELRVLTSLAYGWVDPDLGRDGTFRHSRPASLEYARRLSTADLTDVLVSVADDWSGIDLSHEDVELASGLLDGAVRRHAEAHLAPNSCEAVRTLLALGSVLVSSDQAILAQCGATPYLVQVDDENRQAVLDALSVVSELDAMSLLLYELRVPCDDPVSVALTLGSLSPIERPEQLRTLHTKHVYGSRIDDDSIHR